MRRFILLPLLLLLVACVAPGPTPVPTTPVQPPTATPSPSPTLTPTPRPTPTPEPSPTPTATATTTPTPTPSPTPTETPTLTPEVAREIPPEVTRIEGLALRYNEEKGWWEYVDSSGRAVAHFVMEEDGDKRIEIDVMELDFEKHPELYGLFESLPQKQIAALEKQAIKENPWVFMLPVSIEEIGKISQIIIDLSDTRGYKVYLLGISLRKGDGPAIVYAPVSGEAAEGRASAAKSWTSYMKITLNRERKLDADITVEAADGNIESFHKGPSGTYEWRNVGDFLYKINNRNRTISRYKIWGRVTHGKDEYNVVVVVDSNNPNMWKRTAYKGNLENLLRDPETGKIISVKQQNKTSMRENKALSAKEMRERAKEQASATITSARARSNKTPFTPRVFS